MKKLAASLKATQFGEKFLRRNPLYYKRALRLFATLESEDVESRIRFTTDRLRTLLRAAMQTEYGRTVGGGEDIESWPVLDKEPVRTSPTQFITSRSLWCSHAATSGTTGTPISLVRSPESVTYEQAGIDHILMKKGVDPQRYRAAMLRGEDIKDPGDRNPPFWKYAANGRILIFSSNHLNNETVDDFARELMKFKPHAMHAYPTILESFCRLLEASGEKAHVPVTLCQSEMLTGDAWARAERVLGTQVIDKYGQAERTSFAYAFERKRFFFLPGYAFNEFRLVDQYDDYSLYELIATGLWNLTMPLIRYATGDLIELPKGSDLEAIAYGKSPFSGVIGRSGDFLIAPDGARLMGIDHIPREVANVVRIQVVQETPAQVRILVLPEPGFSDADRRTIEQNVNKKLPPSMSWKLEVVQELERNSVGKTPFVIRRF